MTTLNAAPLPGCAARSFRPKRRFTAPTAGRLARELAWRQDRRSSAQAHRLEKPPATPDTNRVTYEDFTGPGPLAELAEWLARLHTGLLRRLARTTGPLLVDLARVHRPLREPVIVTTAAHQLGAAWPPLVCPKATRHRGRAWLQHLFEAGVQRRYHGDFGWCAIRIATSSSSVCHTPAALRLGNLSLGGRGPPRHRSGRQPAVPLGPELHPAITERDEDRRNTPSDNEPTNRSRWPPASRISHTAGSPQLTQDCCPAIPETTTRQSIMLAVHIGRR
ncbi:DUF2399 domain-containing protein [Amycolatopsis samaneae]|uniref:DUF2399 domain-containing protein n=1 Tax=Amycolatopsis samaneae TaxID=664691 RepID=A0ABW5GDR7_9PSEU